MAVVAIHTSRTFEGELDELRRATVAMGDKCRLALRTALDAFHSGETGRVEEVRRIDRLIDQDEKAIDALTLRILALRQPVASDLRLLTMALKLVTDLERIGDEAVNIAERVEDGRCEVSTEMQTALEAMSEEAQRMVSAALEAFIAGDADKARDVLGRDDGVDEMYARAMRGMEQYMMTRPSEVRAALSVMSIAKYLERVADHATNIAEEVVFMVRGEDVRHHKSVRRLPDSDD